jgi:hypothetical protein
MTPLTSQFERKVNYAFSVNRITPHVDFPGVPSIASISNKKPLYCDYLRLFLLDNSMIYGIIRLTGKLSYSGDPYHGRLWRCKIGSTWSKWHIKCPSGGCCRRVILRQRVFRPSRSAAGQVRDASAGSPRWNDCFKSCKNVRFFACFILPDTARLRPARISRLDASSSRPKTCSQANRRCDGIYFGLQKQKSVSSGNGSGNPDKTAFRIKRTSSQYRTCTAASAKKRAINLSEPDEYLDHCVERYEQLRKMILETRDYSCHGWGLALLLHRGFAAWVYAFSKIESSQQQSPVPVTPVPDKACLAIPDTIRGRMIMTISDMVLSTLQGVAL